MALRIIRIPKLPKPTKGDALQAIIVASAVTRDLSNMALFPPAAAAVSIVGSILTTVQSNKEACKRLARRCAAILEDIADQMDGRWHRAPPLLIRNLQRFEQTLTRILQFMEAQAKASWGERFVRKFSVEAALADFHAMLDDAIKSFQIATLIDIHHAVANPDGGVPTSAGGPEAPPPYSPQEGSASPESKFIGIHEEQHAPLLETPEEPVEDINLYTEGVLEDHGFRRFHQSGVRLKTNSKMNDGWWSNAAIAEIDGRTQLVKRYDGQQNQALRHWLHDVKLLQNIYHPNLPQLVGYSAGDAPTPFIVLSNVQTRAAPSLLLNVLRKEGLAACANLALNFYKDVTEATFYLQRQRGLDDHGLQDFVDKATFRVDGSNKLIMGLPPPDTGNWVTARNYGLTESLRGSVLKLLPNSGVLQYRRDDEIDKGDMTRSITHIVSLIRGLLPAENAPSSLPACITELIEPEDNLKDDFSLEPPKLSLRQVRLTNIEANTHNHSWYQNSSIPPHKFEAGDFGYLPDGGNDFNAFMKLGNIFKDHDVKEESGYRREAKAYGSQWCWDDFGIPRVPMQSFPLPQNIHCWPISVPPRKQIDCQVTHEHSIVDVGQTWKFMLDNAQRLAEQHSIKPEELILIIRAGLIQDFYIRDFRPAPLPLPFSNRGPTPVPPGFGFPQRPGFGHPSHPTQAHTRFPHQNHMPPLEPSIPSIMYLMTCGDSDPEWEPYWSHSPMAVPKGTTPPNLDRHWT
ncbi:hypothetical protein AX16_001103 [Volvariella volvacea WC 439]|nr:hypothetical protein AX16_001103 [Volvariella volvacea WC 439]